MDNTQLEVLDLHGGSGEEGRKRKCVRKRAREVCVTPSLSLSLSLSLSQAEASHSGEEAGAQKRLPWR
jgi:hypothetical protein